MISNSDMALPDLGWQARRNAGPANRILISPIQVNTSTASGSVSCPTAGWAEPRRPGSWIRSGAREGSWQ